MGDGLKKGLFGAAMAGAGYFVSNYMNRDRLKKFKMGVSLTAVLFLSAYVSVTQLIPKWMDKKYELENTREQNKLKREQLEFMIEEKRIEKGYLPQNLEKTLEQRQSRMDSLLKQQSQALYSSLEKVLDGIAQEKDGTPSTSFPEERTRQDIRTAIYRTGQDADQRISSNVLVHINKAKNMLYVSNGNDKILYSCPVSLAKSGGPASGRYEVRTIEPRSGRLYPGVIKLTDVIVITGCGENDEYAGYVQGKVNINNTGVRMYNEDYRNVTSLLRDKHAIVEITY